MKIVEEDTMGKHSWRDVMKRLLFTFPFILTVTGCIGTVLPPCGTPGSIPGVCQLAFPTMDAQTPKTPAYTDTQNTPPFVFSGFFPPVDNLPVFNEVNAGRGIPVKFSLGSNQGLGVFVAGYPKSQEISCDSTALVDGIEQTVAAGPSSLSYDPSIDQYIYVWKTEQAWANTCRQLVVKLNDNSVHMVNFKFK